MRVRIIEETVRGIELMPIEDQMFRSRKIFMTEPVTMDSAGELLKQLMYLEESDPGKEIELYISSPGGEVTCGLTVCDYIRQMKSPVTTICIGLAASMGSILFLAGEKRRMYPHSKIMIHDPSYARADMSGQKPGEIKEHLNGLMATRRVLAGIIAERTGMTLKQVYARTKKDTYFTAEEALKLGIATEIIDA